jgi:hypothetical protein
MIDALHTRLADALRSMVRLCALEPEDVTGALAAYEAAKAAPTSPSNEINTEIIDLLVDIMHCHRDADSGAYNDCDKPGEQCQWCARAEKVVNVLRQGNAKAAPAEQRACCKVAVDNARQRWLACGDTVCQEMADDIINAKAEARQQRERAEAAEKELEGKSDLEILLEATEAQVANEQKTSNELRKRAAAAAEGESKEFWCKWQETFNALEAAEAKARELEERNEQLTASAERLGEMCDEYSAISKRSLEKLGKAESRLAALTEQEAIDAFENEVYEWDSDLHLSRKMICDALAAARKAVGGG